MSKEVKNDNKVMTKYDLKMQKRKDAREKELQAQSIWKIVGVVVILALVAWIAYAPVKAIIELNKTIFYAGDKEVKTVEFDYYYNTVKANYMDNYGTYLSYYGLTEDTDPSTVEYADGLTFKDFFEEMAVEQIQENVGVMADLAANGFSYDATDDYAKYLDTITKEANTQGISVNKFLKSRFGKYATKNRLKEYVENGYIIAAYYQKIYDEKLPSDAEITSYYEENRDTYDSVSYYIDTVYADLPTEPTALADEEPIYDADGDYVPSDAEKEAAMKEAKKLADARMETIMDDGDYEPGDIKSNLAYDISGWLFDSARVAGETTVIEDTYSSMYYVLGFESRYLKEEPTVNFRAVVTNEDNGATIKSVFDATDKSEASFIKLVNDYSEDTSADDGLYEDMAKENFDVTLSTWLFDESRKEGDVESFLIEGNYTYVIYYLGYGQSSWKVKATESIMSNTMNSYLEEMSSTVEVLDPKGNLNYMLVNAMHEENAETEDTTEAE